MAENQKINNFVSGVWSERVLVVTQDYEIKGYVFMPKTGKRNRVLSDICGAASLPPRQRLLRPCC